MVRCIGETHGSFYNFQINSNPVLRLPPMADEHNFSEAGGQVSFELIGLTMVYISVILNQLLRNILIKH